MGRSSRKTVEMTENEVLAVIERTASPRRPACLSQHDIACRIGVSVGRARNACRNLERQGLMAVEPRFAPDGGQLANGYRLTSAGRERLKKALAREMLTNSVDVPRARSRDPALAVMIGSERVSSATKLETTFDRRNQ